MKFKKKVTVVQIDSKHFVATANGYTLVVCNSTGIEIIKMLNSNFSIDYISDKMSEEYNIDKSVVKADAEKLIEKLREAGLLDE